MRVENPQIRIPRFSPFIQQREVGNYQSQVKCTAESSVAMRLPLLCLLLLAARLAQVQLHINTLISNQQVVLSLDEHKVHAVKCIHHPNPSSMSHQIIQTEVAVACATC